jgi:hypothetical protein
MTTNDKPLGRKLSGFIEWFEMPEAARYLSDELRRDISIAHILRMVLGKNLKLSIYIINPTEARKGRVVPIGQAETIIEKKDNPYEEEDLHLDEGWVFDDLPEEIKKGLQDGSMISHPIGEIMPDQTHVVTGPYEPATLSGIYDVPMMGNNIREVEDRLQIAMNGPDVTCEYFVGTFFEDQEGSVYMYTSRHEEEALRQITNKYIINDAATTNSHLEKIELLHSYIDNEFPLGGVFPEPEDYVLVVRVSALNKLIEQVESEQRYFPQANPEELVKNLQEQNEEKEVIAALLKKECQLSPWNIAKLLNISPHLDRINQIGAIRKAARDAIKKGQAILDKRMASA